MRQFVSEENLSESGTLIVTGKKFHYLTAVLRSAPGDMINVRLPDGSLQGMTLCSVDNTKKSLVLQAAGDIAESDSSLHALPLKEMPPVEIWLFQFIAKPAKMELILRQAVECGVSHFVPVEGVFSQKGNIDSARKHSAQADGRWQRIITEAREQSGSPVKTAVHKACTLEEAVALWKSSCPAQSANLSAVLYEMNRNTLSMHGAVKKAGSEKKPITHACLAVGSEGGISPEELSFLLESGFVSVHFSTNILRCETAALYGIAALETAVFEREDWECRE